MPSAEHYVPPIHLPSPPVVGMTVSVPIPFGSHDFSITMVGRGWVILSTFFDGKRFEVKRRPRVVVED